MLTILVLLGISPRYLSAQETYELAFYDAGLFNSNGVGIDRDVVAELAKRTGLMLKTSEKPRARIWQEMAAGKLAMTVSGIQNTERNAYAWFLPYITQRNMALVLASKAGKYRNLSDFIQDEDAIVGVVRSFVHGGEYEKAVTILRSQSRVEEFPSIEQLFQVMASGKRMDMIFALPVFYNPLIKQYGMGSMIRILDWDTGKTPVAHCLVLSRKLVSEADYLLIKKELASMRQDGTLRRIFSRYLSGAELEECFDY